MLLESSMYLKNLVKLRQKKEWSQEKLAVESVIAIYDFLEYGLPLVAWYVSAQILNIGDRYIIKYFLGNVEVGIYSANYSIVYGVTTLLSAPFILAFSLLRVLDVKLP